MWIEHWFLDGKDETIDRILCTHIQAIWIEFVDIKYLVGCSSNRFFFPTYFNRCLPPNERKLKSLWSKNSSRLHFLKDVHFMCNSSRCSRGISLKAFKIDKRKDRKKTDDFENYQKNERSSKLGSENRLNRKCRNISV